MSAVMCQRTVAGTFDAAGGSGAPPPVDAAPPVDGVITVDLSGEDGGSGAPPPVDGVILWMLLPYTIPADVPPPADAAPPVSAAPLAVPPPVDVAAPVSAAPLPVPSLVDVATPVSAAPLPVPPPADDVDTVPGTIPADLQLRFDSQRGTIPADLPGSFPILSATNSEADPPQLGTPFSDAHHAVRQAPVGQFNLVCSTCGSPVQQLSNIRLLSKKSQTFRCTKCSVKMTQLIREFGSAKKLMSLPQEKLTKFFREEHVDIVGLRAGRYR